MQLMNRAVATSAASKLADTARVMAVTCNADNAKHDQVKRKVQLSLLTMASVLCHQLCVNVIQTGLQELQDIIMTPS